MNRVNVETMAAVLERSFAHLAGGGQAVWLNRAADVLEALGYVWREDDWEPPAAGGGLSFAHLRGQNLARCTESGGERAG